MVEISTQSLFDVERYLESYSENGISFYEKKRINTVDLEKLCKKIDVVKKVYTFYTVDLKAKSSNLEISERHYFILLDMLRNYAFQLKDFKYLNSYLKLVDLMNIKGFLTNERVVFLRLEAENTMLTWIKN